jgi:hypothetical protein
MGEVASLGGGGGAWGISVWVGGDPGSGEFFFDIFFFFFTRIYYIGGFVSFRASRLHFNISAVSF